MAHQISEYTRAVAPHGAFTLGDVKDDPSGTLVNRLMMTDSLQFWQGLMALGNVTPNGGDDGPTYGTSQLMQALRNVINSNFGILDATQSGAWINFGNLVSTAVGGTFSGGTTVYNKYKLIQGNTLVWSIQYRTGTIAGAVNTIKIPWPFGLTGGTWKNAGGESTQRITFGGHATPNHLNVILNDGGAGVPYLELYYDGGNFPTSGNVNLDITITTEL